MIRKNCLACGYIFLDESMIKTKEKKCSSCSKQKKEIITMYICARCGCELGIKK